MSVNFRSQTPPMPSALRRPVRSQAELDVLTPDSCSTRYTTCLSLRHAFGYSWILQLFIHQPKHFSKYEANQPPDPHDRSRILHSSPLGISPKRQEADQQIINQLDARARQSLENFAGLMPSTETVKPMLVAPQYLQKCSSSFVSHPNCFSWASLGMPWP